MSKPGSSSAPAKIVVPAGQVEHLAAAAQEVRPAYLGVRQTGPESYDALWKVPGPPVEAAIALSIVFVAAEIIHCRQGMAGLTERFPWVVAFTFGLLHGFGSASAPNEVGLPQAAIPSALLFFNVGVELGQLLFIASVFTVIALARQVTRRIGVSQPAWAWRVPPDPIGTVAAFWIIERIAAF